MRVLHVIQELRRGGAETVVLSLMQHLGGSGHHAAVAAAPGPWAAAFGPSYPLPLLRRRAHAVPMAAAQLRRALRDFRPDVVHCHNPGMAVVTALATWGGRRPPALVTVHGVPEADYPRTASTLRRTGLPVIACGPGVAHGLGDHGCPVSATVVNGVTPSPLPADRAGLHKEWGVGPHRPLLVTVGRLIPQKRHDRTLHLMPHLPDAHLLVLGEGPLLADLQELASGLGVGDRVTFAGVRSDARALMGAADVVLMSSDWEGLPLTLLEAMSSQTPIVATAVRGTVDLLQHEHNALLAPPDRTGQFLTSVRRVLDSPGLARFLAEGAHADAEHYSAQQMGARYLEAYRSLTTSQRRWKVAA